MAEIARRPTVLVVDDEDNARLLARLSLERIGCVVVEAADGPSAIARARQALPDLLLLDVVMPGLDGFAVCEALRADPEFRNVPIVMMTALEEMDSVERAYAIGATDFIAKPVNWSLLQHRARFLLRAAENLVELDSSRARLQEAQRIARLGSWSLALDDHRFVGSQELWRILDRGPEDVPDGDAYLELVQGADRRYVRAARARAAETGVAYEIEYRLDVSTDGLRHVVERGEALARRGDVRFLVGTLHDVTEERLRSEQIRHMTTHDPVTGLLNGRGLQEQLEARLEHGGLTAALFHLDLGFVHQNVEVLGHDAVETLLVSASRRLQEALHAAVPGFGALLARQAHDRFVVVAPGIDDDEAATEIAERLAKALGARLAVDDRTLTPEVRIGIATTPRDGRSAATLLDRARIAAQAVEPRRGASIGRYSETLEANYLEQFSLESELRTALERDELSLEFQPIFAARTGRIHAAEALLRWDNRRYGRVGPDRFVPLAEELGLIEEIGEWVLDAACREAARWHSTTADAPIVAVNLSAAQLGADADIVGAIERALARHRLPAGALEVELTESLLVEASTPVRPVLAALRELRVPVSLDDFGTGFSSLSYLARFPVDTLKVDRSFLADVPGDRRRERVLAAIIALAHGLGLKVIVEGVETQGQLDFLRRHDADLLQGYLLGRPMPGVSLRELLAEGSGAATSRAATG